jgi:hypothetical protein
MIRPLTFGLMLGLCGSCGDSNGSSGGAVGMSWDDDGTRVTAWAARATLDNSGGADTYQISSLGTDPGDVSFTVTAPSPISPQMFVCTQTMAGQSVRVTYTPSAGGIEFMVQSCAVVLTQTGLPGAKVVGTFEVVFNLQAGGTKTISNGKIDLLVGML